MSVTSIYGGLHHGNHYTDYFTAIEAFFFIWSAITKSGHNAEKSIVRISEFVLLAIMLITGMFEWGFRYYMVLGVLAIQTALSVNALIKKKERSYKLSKTIFLFLQNGFLYTFALTLAILCPQYEQPAITGGYEIATAQYTWVDEGRIEIFTDTGE